ncbi:YkvA family protein [Blastococcus sp. TF02A-30]|uniref:YkvA family protein n=1 Tax=Blastococcus sp. TF02A-30 TaxID=2250580 RepID=UPI001F2B26B1|nr:YkvA family protein [Blastococcus sp. TF02A-30]
MEELLVAASGLLLLWLLLVLLLWRSRALAAREALRLLPDLVRLVRRLAADRSLPRGLRLRLWVLLAYLLSPLDLVPDVVPVLGYADDVVVVAWALRAVVRRAGGDALARHWPGSPAGLAVVTRLAGLRPTADGGPPG